MKMLVGFLLGVIGVGLAIVATSAARGEGDVTGQAQAPTDALKVHAIPSTQTERPSPDNQSKDMSAALVREVRPESPDPALWGEVLCRMSVSKTGNVESVEVVRSSGHQQLDDAARTALSQWLYAPQRRDGKPVAVTIDRLVSFPKRTPLDLEDLGMAWAVAQTFIEGEHLHSPSSAEWPTDGLLPAHSYREFVTYKGQGKYRISSWVDSDNAFGAKIRTRFVATVVDRGAGDWRLTEFDVVD